jgi:hypothetical protein
MNKSYTDNKESPEVKKKDSPELSETKKESHGSSSGSKRKPTFHNPTRSPSQKIPSKRELNFTPKKDSPIRERNKFDFASKSILTEDEKNEVESTKKVPLHSAKFLKFSFESFIIFSKKNIGNEWEKSRGPITSEKNMDLVTKTGSNFNPKFGGPDKKSLFGLKTKTLIPSIEELNPFIEKGINTNSPNSKTYEEKTISENNLGSLESRNYHEFGTELDFDKMKIYKIYFIHNNIDQVLSKTNAFLERRRVLSTRKNRKILIKKTCKKKICR